MPAKKVRPDIPDYHTKKQIAIRLTDDGHELLERVSAHLGVGKADAIEMSVREIARKFKIEL